ncbi:MAG: hypothetical protein HY248_03460, partial [Fimbriimonas ginsengisoli]|nr:hypothetical protein [Fimbriimonas ginsengisoli]
TVTGATSFFQVDPAAGMLYFSQGDEDRTLSVAYTGVDESTGAAVSIPAAPYQTGMLVERAETPVPIEQSINESGLAAFLDAFDPGPSPGQRPGLIWLFWTSTRRGGADLYMQTIAPRFRPLVAGR